MFSFAAINNDDTCNEIDPCPFSRAAITLINDTILAYKVLIDWLMDGLIDQCSTACQQKTCKFVSGITFS